MKHWSHVPHQHLKQFCIMMHIISNSTKKDYHTHTKEHVKYNKEKQINIILVCFILKQPKSTSNGSVPHKAGLHY